VWGEIMYIDDMLFLGTGISAFWKFAKGGSITDRDIAAVTMQAAIDVAWI
jgi:hypothetical protein